MIRKALKSLETDENGWANLSRVGSQLINLFPDFDSRTFGSAKLSDLAIKTGYFVVSKSAGNGMRIRAKPSK